MSLNIGSDANRFKDIIKNKFKDNLDKHISSKDLIVQQGNKKITIPIHSIDLPRFTFGNNGGIGQGNGSKGDPIDGQFSQDEKGKAGQNNGDFDYNVEFEPDELAQMLGEKLQLPNIENKGKGLINSVKDRYNSIHNNGPEGLKHFKKTYKEALKRSLVSNIYDPNNPSIIPIKNDKRYKSSSYKEEPDCNTIVIYMADISGSMGDKEKHLVKSTVFWIDLWLSYQYKNILSKFIVHDSEAKEINKEDFFLISSNGGTKISSAYELCLKIIEKEHPFNDWNVYLFYFGDSDNYDSDNKLCLDLMDKLLLNCNNFAYGHVNDDTENFASIIEKVFESNIKMNISILKSSNDILPSIKKFFNSGL